VVLEKGNREDWFASPFIVWMSVAAVYGDSGVCPLGAAHSAPGGQTFVYCATGVLGGAIFAVVLGFGLFGGIFILPVFLQQLQHFTPCRPG